MRETGIVFDLDGTLLDTLEDLTDSTNAMLAHFGFPGRTMQEVRRFVGNGAGRLVAQAVPEGTPETIQIQALQWFQNYYGAHCQEKTKPYAGILQALQQLRDMGYAMAVVSNKPDGAVKSLVAHWFPGLVARGEGPDCPRKPAPDMLMQAMEKLGVKDCIYVGDSEVDVATAQAAGVPCLSVLWGFRDEAQLRRAGAQHVCTRPEELIACLAEMEKNNGK